MDGEFCGFCGGAKATRIKWVSVGVVRRGPARPDGKRRRRRKEIPREKVSVRYCPACAKRDEAERTERNTPERWLAYVRRNPLYFEAVFGSKVTPAEAVKALFKGRGFVDVRGRVYKKARRIHVQVAAL